MGLYIYCWRVLLRLGSRGILTSLAGPVLSTALLEMSMDPFARCCTVDAWRETRSLGSLNARGRAFRSGQL